MITTNQIQKSRSNNRLCNPPVKTITPEGRNVVMGSDRGLYGYRDFLVASILKKGILVIDNILTRVFSSTLQNWFTYIGTMPGFSR